MSTGRVRRREASPFLGFGLARPGPPGGRGAELTAPSCSPSAVGDQGEAQRFSTTPRRNLLCRRGL